MSDCPTGFLYYTCAAIDFSGCCALDPCNGGCPGTAFFATSTSVTPAKTTSTVDSETTSTQDTRTQKSNPDTPAPPPAPAQTTQATSSTVNTSTVAPFSSAAIPASTSSSSTATIAPTNSSLTSSQDTAISGMSRATVAGVIVGAILALAMIVILILLFRLRRRRNRASRHRSTIARRDSMKPLEPASTDDDIFAPYGGFYRGSSDATSPATPSLLPDTTAAVMREKLAPPPEPQHRQEHIDAGPPTPRTKYLIDNPSRDVPAINAEQGPAQLDDTQLLPPKRLSQQDPVEMADTSLGTVRRQNEEKRTWGELVTGRQSAPFSS